MNTAPNGYHSYITNVGGDNVDLKRMSRDFVLYCTKARLPKQFVRTTRSETKVARKRSSDQALERKYV